MAELSLPSEAYRESFLEAMQELRDEGRGSPDDSTSIGRDLRSWTGSWETAEGFARYVADVRAKADESAVLPPNWVHSTTWWWVDGGEYVGRIALRHRLTRFLLDVGGHIGYDVRPTARRRGHATAMLAAVLPEAHEMGIDPALLTCDVDNLASRKVIEANGGELEDARAGKLRFWVPTARAVAAQ